MTMDSPFTERTLWLERTRSLEPAVAQWRDAGEQLRHMPDELFKVIRDAGIFRLALPKQLGGGTRSQGGACRVSGQVALWV